MCQFKNFMQKGCKSTKIKSKEDIVPEWCPLEKKKDKKGRIDCPVFLSEHFFYEKRLRWRKKINNDKTAKTIKKNKKNKLGLSCAKLSSAEAI